MPQVPQVGAEGDAEAPGELSSWDGAGLGDGLGTRADRPESEDTHRMEPGQPAGKGTAGRSTAGCPGACRCRRVVGVPWGRGGDAAERESHLSHALV